MVAELNMKIGEIERTPWLLLLFGRLDYRRKISFYNGQLWTSFWEYTEIPTNVSKYYIDPSIKPPAPNRR